MSHLENMRRIKIVHNALGKLANQFFFIGGATVSLYTDRLAEEIRPTDDVDILIELTGYNDYVKIEEELRQRGFMNDLESGIICRYQVNGIIVDVMSTSEDVLGFANRWYKEGVQHALTFKIDSETTIRIFQPVYFLASKIEAFKNRGEGDGRWSSDFEDIIYLLNNRSAIWQEMRESQEPVLGYLREEVNCFLENKYLDEWISCHLEFSEQRRASFIIGSLQEFVRLTTLSE